MSDFQGLPKTKNLNLNKPGYDNVADIMALNENADIIDAAIKTNIDDIANIKKGYVKTVNGVGVDSKGNVNVKEYTHPNSGVTAGSYRKVTVDALGHVTAGENPILAISEGGTGADNVSSARANLGIDTTYFNPTGSIIAFAGNALPAGYLLCDGSKVSRTTYKKLFDVIGTTYGAGDGTTTFTLPNLIDRFLEGSSAAGKYHDAGLPNIEGELDWHNASIDQQIELYAHSVSQRGALSITKQHLAQYINAGTGTNSFSGNFLFDASKSNSIYGASSTVQPPALTVQFIVKY